MSTKESANNSAAKAQAKDFQAKTSRGEATRQKLLDAAEEVFGVKGYFRASVVDITLKAGVAQGTFYVYFPGKQDIFAELVRELNHDLRREISQAVTGLTSRREVEARGFAVFFSFIRKHSNLYRIMQQVEFVDEDLFKWYYRRLAQGYVQGVEAAMEGGEFRRLDPETVAYALMGIAEFIGMRWVLWEGKDVPAKALDTVMGMVMDGLHAD